MKAYHGKIELKEKFMGRVREHRQKDELIKMATQGRGKDGSFKGCAVVCTMESYDHGAYESEIGVPRILARLEDGIFEGLPQDEAMAWPERFLEAIPVGADLSRVGDQFLHWLLVGPQDGVIRFAKTERTRKAIEDVGALYAKKVAGETVSIEDWQRVRAYAAAYAAAADAAAYAAADAAADAAAAAAYAAARDKARIRQAEKLIELMKAAPCTEPVAA